MCLWQHTACECAEDPAIVWAFYEVVFVVHLLLCIYAGGTIRTLWMQDRAEWRRAFPIRGSLVLVHAGVCLLYPEPELGAGVGVALTMSAVTILTLMLWETILRALHYLSLPMTSILVWIIYGAIAILVSASVALMFLGNCAVRVALWGGLAAAYGIATAVLAILMVKGRIERSPQELGASAPRAQRVVQCDSYGPAQKIAVISALLCFIFILVALFYLHDTYWYQGVQVLVAAAEGAFMWSLVAAGAPQTSLPGR